MKRKTWRRSAAVLFAALMMFISSVPVQAETAAERYQRLKEELAGISSQIESYENDKAAALQLKSALQEQKAVLDELITLNQQQLSDTQARLEVKQTEITEKRQTIYENDQLLQQRLVAIYKMNDASILSVFLMVDSFSEFITVAKNLQLIMENDTQLLNLLDAQRTALETEQAEIDALLVELQEAYAELEENARVLAENIAAQDSRISRADANIAAQEQAYDETYADLVAAQKEMAQISNSIQSSTSSDGSEYVGGQLQWPVPEFYDISCYFGSADPNGAGHRGMDIRGSGITGATIVAAGSGTVVSATYAHSSYGNYVVIDHGAGIRTLYAHCSALWVSAGDYVSAGTGIGSVGSTGFVTGPHLHLEVQLNGVPQNPLSYLK